MIEGLSDDAILYVVAGIITTVGGFIFKSQIEFSKSQVLLTRVIKKLDKHLDQSQHSEEKLIELDKRVLLLENA